MNVETSITQHAYDTKTLTLITTALVTACNFIPDPTTKFFCVSASPCVTIFSAYIFKKLKKVIYLGIEHRRAVKAYKIIISECSAKLQQCKNPKEKSKLKAELEKHEKSLVDLRIKNITAFA